ncbi:MAG: S41 family peptidase [Candidatus Faecousia sp.]|nr:S41 family peptidase [Candidatus Faecousia sp.]
MKKKILLTLSHILVAALAAVVTLAIAVPKADISKLDQLESLILERFIGDSDRVAMEDAAAEAMVDSLGDRWSYYIPADEYEAYQEQVANAFVGVGITIQLTEESQGLLVVDVTRGGPAEEAGILVGDTLVAVEQTRIAGMSTTEVRNLVRGEEGTWVSLTLSRDGREETFSVERRRIEVPVATFSMLDNHVGLVRIENFDQRCAQETIAAIEALLAQGAEGLIFDVRGNPGGYADEMVKILDYLLPEGELFRTVDYAGRERVDTSDADCLELPMAVLVNQDSYSAAEFFAAALREYDWAVVVGQKTCGKGYFQNTLPLSDGSAVGLSVGKYFTPNGQSLADVGVTPDRVVEVGEDTRWKIYYGTLPTEEDVQLETARELLETE